MATKKTAATATTKKKAAPKNPAAEQKKKKKAPEKKAPEKKAAEKKATTTTTKATPSTVALAKLLQTCSEALEVKIPEENGIAVRLKTRQIELPLLVHVGELVVFDLYPFRFVGVDADKVDWPRLIRLCRTGYVQLGLDNDFDDEDVLVYSFHMPLASLDKETMHTVIGTLTTFAEDHYDDVLAATGLVEKRSVQ